MTKLRQRSLGINQKQNKRYPIAVHFRTGAMEKFCNPLLRYQVKKLRIRWESKSNANALFVEQEFVETDKTLSF